MGEARRRKLAGIPAPTERTPPPQKARRLAFKAIRMKSEATGKEYIVHVDGRVYEVRRGKYTQATHRVRDDEEVQLARALAIRQVKG